MHHSPAEREFRSLRDDLLRLRRSLLDAEREHAGKLASTPAPRRESARNLVHYLALRRYDVRDLQGRLANVGLSSLGRAEARVLPNLDRVLWLLGRVLAGAKRPQRLVGPPDVAGRDLLRIHTDDLLGPPPPHRQVRIMVTMPSEAADDYVLMRELLDRGMDCVRINCAHDQPPVWERIVGHLDRARHELGRPCRLLMDLSGPKLRTGAIEPGPQVLKWRPVRDDLGRVVSPARIWLTPVDSPEASPHEGDAALPVPREWLNRTRAGDRIELRDARGKTRLIEVSDAIGASRLGISTQTGYVTPGTELRLATAARRGNPMTHVAELPAKEGVLRLRLGDRLVLTTDAKPGGASRRDREGHFLELPHVPCTLPEVFSQVKSGERIWFDDGKIGGVVRRISANGVQVEIVQCSSQGATLRSDKGINLPDSDLRLPALTAKDVEDLKFASAHADLIGLSFVHRPSDVLDLRRRLQAAAADHVGIVLKIETRRAFERLAELALSALQHPRSGIMIARGDLAVECGYERLAEVQEEVLWIAEAAHLPVIWATQVLENLAKTGQPSRAEITDAAMGERAECVMLNKGPHIAKAVQVLDDILRRMQSHQVKKTAMLRRLHVAEGERPERRRTGVRG